MSIATESPIAWIESAADRQITTRSASLQFAAVRGDERTVETQLADEWPKPVYDLNTGRLIDEVLLMKGVFLPDQVPLLDNHRRGSVLDILGSVDALRVAVDRLTGRLRLAADGKGPASRAWLLLRDGHLSGATIGYAPSLVADIPAGQTRIVEGRTFTARERMLRVVIRWQLKEASLRPVG
ncbi:MAG: hypothetical protein AAFX76_11320 [Planctomycetota bacterium]